MDETNCYDLSKLPGKFDASKVMDLHGGTLDKENNILTVDKMQQRSPIPTIAARTSTVVIS